MDKDTIYGFYDYLLRKIGAESRIMLYDPIYNCALNEFADKLFPDDDERHYQFQSFIEHHIGRLEKEHGLIVVKYNNGIPKEIGLSERGVYVCSNGGYGQYISDKEAAQRQIEEEGRRIKEEEANERKWSIRTNKVQYILGIMTFISMIVEWILSKTDTIYFTISAFVAGCLLGYGVNNLLKSTNTNRYDITLSMK